MVIMTGKMEIRDREAIDHSKNAPEEISELNLQKKEHETEHTRQPVSPQSPLQIRSKPALSIPSFAWRPVIDNLDVP